MAGKDDITTGVRERSAYAQQTLVDVKAGRIHDVLFNRRGNTSRRRVRIALTFELDCVQDLVARDFVCFRDQLDRVPG